MKVLVVGSGGREHAIAWHLANDGVDVCVAPGNGGTPVALPLQASDVEGLAVVAEGIKLPDGLAFSPDEKTLRHRGWFDSACDPRL